MNLNGMNCLVTGAGGFIGSHLTEKLTDLGANTRALVHYNALGSWGWLDKSKYLDSIEVIAGDICDRDSVKMAMKDIDIVFHLAALIAIPYSYHAPASYIKTNVEGTLNVLQNARELGTKRIIQTSTSEVYGTAQYAPIDEKHPLQGQSPYSASKIGADKIAEAFHLSFNTPVVTIRPFNTFGPRQSARAIIPTVISQVLNKQDISLGNLKPTRDLNYVSNTVDGFVKAAVMPNIIGKTINLGSSREISIGDLVKLIGQLMGVEINIVIDNQRIRPKGSEVERLLADNTLAKEILDWEPAISLEQGLEKTINWIKTNNEQYRPNTYTI